VFEEWTGSGLPVGRVDLNHAGALEALEEFYGGKDRGVLREVLDHAYRLGAQTAFVEYRYVDADYRNEHSRFYSTTFRRYPSVAHRLHLFSSRFDPEEAPTPAFYFRNHGYLGYAVMRPVRAAPVGRTMLKAPPNIDTTAITCLAQDSAHRSMHKTRSSAGVGKPPFCRLRTTTISCSDGTVSFLARSPSPSRRAVENSVGYCPRRD
jgi:hypothetical protein